MTSALERKLDDERVAFETHWAKKHGRPPITWKTIFGSSILQQGPMPAHLEGVYFNDAAREAWEAWQAASSNRGAALSVDYQQAIDAERDLAGIYDAFRIDSAARSIHILRENLCNVLRREQCLAAIERTFFMVATEPQEEDGGEPGEECLLNWGQDPAQYVETFRQALKTIGARAQQANREVPIAPDVCPITGRKFWGNMSHPERGMLALYGGPYDSFSIPERCEDGELRSEHYDQDAGEWEEGGVPVGWYSSEQPDDAPSEALAPATVAQPVELQGVAETLANGVGFWHSCSGCHELDEGHDTGPLSAVLNCHLGTGCDECGGIGAYWDTTDYADMAAHALASRDEAPAASAQPMFFVSAEQANALEDRPGDTEGGRYLPVRKTAAGKFTMPLYAAPAEALPPSTVAQSVGVPPGRKIQPDEEGTRVVSPSGDVCYLWDLDSRHEEAGQGHREILRQLSQDLLFGGQGAESKPLTDEALKAAYENAQWAWGGKGDVDAFFLTFGRRVEAAHGITSLPANTSEEA